MSRLLVYNESMKKFFWSLGISSVILIIGAFLLGRFVFPDTSLDRLPVQELSEGQRGKFGIDKNVNEETIDKYLGRSDAVYRDMRMLKDPGNYETIGGDSYLSGYVKGFEVVPLPYLVNVSGLPEEVGETYKGATLFTEKDGVYKANYTESLAILEDLFPKDKYIFLMCGGGGYAGMTKTMLVKLGWDESKIYNVGGYWFYNGENNVSVKRTRLDGETVYDFYKVPYHEIDFNSLTKVSVGDLIELEVSAYEKMIEEGRSFFLFVDQNGCNTADTLRGFVKDYMKEIGSFSYQVMFSDIKGTSLNEMVKYYPSFVIVSNGKIVKYLRADSDEDAGAYNKYDEFLEWVK